MNRDLTERLDRLDAIEAIRQLAARYALAVDSRDVDGWVALFVDDVDCGKRGIGREALRGFIDSAVRKFYRSIHYVCGHTIDYDHGDNATGTVYCRAEHESGGEWIIMAIIYFDKYERRDGAWYFRHREEEHWYSVDQLSRPAEPFQQWSAFANRHPALPARFPTWARFWEQSDQTKIADLTKSPVERSSHPS